MFHTDTLSTLDSNLRFLARGSQIWTEVWVFYDSDATTAGETMAALREAFNTGNGPTCTETERPPPDATSERRTVSRPAFMLPDSAAYALDVLEVSERGGLFEAHVETHVIQHGTYIGLLVLYDYAPADLWSRDAERVLKLFDDQLRDAAEQ
jgi:hypothetical protein